MNHWIKSNQNIFVLLAAESQYLHSQVVLNCSSSSFFVLIENCLHQNVIMQTAYIHTSSYFHCFTCIAPEALHITPHFNGLLSTPCCTHVISHQATVSYDSGFIVFPLSWVLLSSSSVISASLWRSFIGTHTVHQSCISATAWLAASEQQSSDWFSCVLH